LQQKGKNLIAILVSPFCGFSPSILKYVSFGLFVLFFN